MTGPDGAGGGVPGTVEVDGGLPLGEALAAMAAAGTAVAVVRGKEGALAGTVTDGELRAAAVSGCSPETISRGSSALRRSASAGPESPDAERRGALRRVAASRSRVTP